MPIIQVANGASIDMQHNPALSGNITTATQGQIVVTGANVVTDYRGSFYFTSNSFSGDGIVNSFGVSLNGRPWFAGSGFSFSLATYWNYLSVDRNSSRAFPYLFRGNDTFVGAEQNDIFEYDGGNDSFDGREGVNTLYIPNNTAFGVTRFSDGSYGLATQNGSARLFNIQYINTPSQTAIPIISYTYADPTSYLAANPDLVRAGISSVDGAAQHYITNGYRESRGTVFDANAYMASNPDIIRAGISDAQTAMQHYIANGVREGRSTSFDSSSYMAANSDLVRAGITTAASAIQHYIANGIREGRSTSFDANSYIAANPDLVRAGVTTSAAAIQHYIANGIREGRSTSFDSSSYASANPDLARAGITSTSALMLHYINNGVRENRRTSPVRASGQAGDISALATESIMQGSPQMTMAPVTQPSRSSASGMLASA